MVRHVERFGAELYGLLLANPEDSREAHIDIDASRPQNISRTNGPIRSQRRLHERCGVEPGLNVLRGSIRLSQHLIWPLVASPLGYR